LTEEPQKANISKRSKGFSSGVFLFSAKASKKATTTMQDLSEKKRQKSDLVEGNEEKGGGSGTAVESSSQSLAASRECYFFLSFFLCSLLFSLISRHTSVGIVTKQYQPLQFISGDDDSHE
jgi:hypothetical protein